MAGTHVIALTTVPSVEKAGEIARILVEEGLAACVNVIPVVRSIYRWKGETCDEPEVLCMIKTLGAKSESLRVRLLELHPYELPEFLVLDVASGHAAYLSWIADSCR